MAKRSFNIEINKQQLNDVKRMLSGIKGGVRKAMIKTLNQTSKTTKTQFAKKVGEDLNLKSARIKKDIKELKATDNNLQGGVTSTGKPVGLINFAGAQTKKGTKVKVKKSGGAKLVPHAFKASTKTKAPPHSREHLFWRKKGSWSRRRPSPKLTYHGMPNNPKANKYRIKTGGGGTMMMRLTGPRIQDIMAKDEVINPVAEKAADALSKNLGKAADEVLRRFK